MNKFRIIAILLFAIAYGVSTLADGATTSWLTALLLYAAVLSYGFYVFLRWLKGD